MTKALFLLEMPAAPSSIKILDKRLGSWRFQWINNMVQMVGLFEYDSNDISKSYDDILGKKGIGPILDVLTLATEKSISPNISHKVYELTGSLAKLHFSRSKSIDEVIGHISRVQSNLFASADESWPPLIQPGVATTEFPSTLALIEHVVDEICRNESRAGETSNLKLMNYWRRGYNLGELYFEEESFLAHFKILEYFGKSARVKIRLLNRLRGKKISTADRIVKGLSDIIPEINKNSHYIYDFAKIRNNDDIAHSRISSEANERSHNLYYVHNQELWQHQAEISTLTKFAILKRLMVSGIEIGSESGLLQIRLEQIKAAGRP